jgi:hypothetical protein
MTLIFGRLLEVMDPERLRGSICIGTFFRCNPRIRKRYLIIVTRLESQARESNNEAQPCKEPRWLSRVSAVRECPKLKFFNKKYTEFRPKDCFPDRPDPVVN